MNRLIQLLGQTDVYIFCFTVVITILISIRKKEKRSFEDRLIFRFGIITACLMLTDTVAWGIDGLPGPILRDLNCFLNVVLFAGIDIPAFLWSVYVTHIVRQDREYLRRFITLAVIPLVVNVFLALSNPFTGLLFTIDSLNTYHRGPLVSVNFAISGFYLIYTFTFTAISKKKIHHRILKPLLFFPLPPLVCGALQLYSYGLTLFYPGLIMSILIVYVLVQNSRLTTDYLTGVGNRLSVDDSLREFFAECCRGRAFGAIMLDVDDFKSINDTYGHLVGDEVLERVATALNASIRRNDFVGRYAGDEFIVLIRNDDGTTLRNAAERIEKTLDRYNAVSGRSFRISVSMGCALCMPGEWTTPEEFIVEIDRRMYDNKKDRKAASAAP